MKIANIKIGDTVGYQCKHKNKRSQGKITQIYKCGKVFIVDPNLPMGIICNISDIICVLIK